MPIRDLVTGRVRKSARVSLAHRTSQYEVDPQRLHRTTRMGRQIERRGSYLIALPNGNLLMDECLRFRRIYLSLPIPYRRPRLEPHRIGRRRHRCKSRLEHSITHRLGAIISCPQTLDSQGPHQLLASPSRRTLSQPLLSGRQRPGA